MHWAFTEQDMDAKKRPEVAFCPDAGPSLIPGKIFAHDSQPNWESELHMSVPQASLMHVRRPDGTVNSDFTRRET